MKHILFFTFVMAIVSVSAQTNTANPDTVCYQLGGSVYTVPSSPDYTYTWEVSAPGVIESGQGSNLINVDWSSATPGLISGGVLVFATDADGCVTDTLDLDIFIYNLQPTITSPGTVCEGDPCFNLQGSPAGGSWSGNGVTGNQFCPVQSGPGTFTVTYTYVDVCTFTSTLDVVVSPQLSATITPPGTICENETVTLQASTPGGTWSSSCGNCINPNTGVFSAGTAGVGSHTVLYGFGTSCSGDASLNINVVAAVDASISAIPELCETGGTLTLTAAQGGGVWSASCGNCLEGNVFNPQVSGPGMFTVSYEISGPCSDLDLIDVVVLDQKNALFTMLDPLCLDAGTYGPIAQQNGGVWSASCDDCITPGGIINLNSAGMGEIEVTYTFEGLCGAQHTATTEIVPCSIGFPNIFSPNNDGVNDMLRFDNLQFFRDSRLVVTNRWGHVVYENDRYNAANNWRAEDVPEGTYFYVLTLPDGTDHTGTFMIVRTTRF